MNDATGRDAILSRLRAALVTSEAAPGARQRAVAARLSAPPRHPRPAFAGLEGDAAASRLMRCLEAQGASVTEVATLAALPDAVARIAGAHGPLMRLVMGNDARLATLQWPAGTAPARWTAEQPLGDGYAALTHARGGVAETGTLVLRSDAASPASLAFLPELHIVALDRETIVGSFEEALTGLAGETSGRLPRAVNLVSSPSRTSDIGGRSVRGAHGPRHLAVVVYGSTLAVAAEG